MAGLNPQIVLSLVLTKVNGTPLIFPNMTKFGESGNNVDDVEITDFESAGFKEFFPGMRDGGEIPVEGFVKDEVKITSMFTLSQTNGIQAFELQFPNAAKLFFAAYLKEFKFAEMTPGDARSYKFNLKVTGKPIYATSGISS